MPRLVLLFVLALVGLAPRFAAAHEVMGTVVYVDLEARRARLDVEIPVDELALALGKPPAGPERLPASRAELTGYVREHLAVRTPAGVPFALAFAARDVVSHDARDWFVLDVDAAPPGDASPRDFVIATDLISHVVVNHHVFVFLRRDAPGGKAGDEPIYLDTLHYQSHEAHVDGGPAKAAGLGALFTLGMRHIRDGADHLLFLFTLLLPASLALGARRWGARRAPRAATLAVLRIVTAFTVGHSITLLVGALGLAHLPAALVESLIAASILVSAAHAIRPLFPRREAWVALGFGLVHGLGFVSALEGLGMEGSGLVLSVLAFNLGVEVMQALLVALVLPAIFVLAGTRFAAPVRIGGAALAAIAAGAWLLQRALGVESRVVPLVDALFAHGPWIVAALVVLALVARRAPAIPAPPA